jgi:hypothetical protein
MTGIPEQIPLNGCNRRRFSYDKLDIQPVYKEAETGASRIVPNYATNLIVLYSTACIFEAPQSRPFRLNKCPIIPPTTPQGLPARNPWPNVPYIHV